MKTGLLTLATLALLTISGNADAATMNAATVACTMPAAAKCVKLAKGQLVMIAPKQDLPAALAADYVLIQPDLEIADGTGPAYAVKAKFVND